MTITTTLIITPAQAEKELARRKAGKGTAKHRAYPKAHIMRAAGAELRAILAAEAAMLAANAEEALAVEAPVQADMLPLELVWVRIDAAEMLLTADQARKALAVA